MFTAMNFTGESLRLIDQRRLPHEEVWIEGKDLETVAQAIENMTVRGAPAIATAALYALVLDARVASFKTWSDYRARFFQGCQRLQATRPTAVNLFNALNAIRQEADTWPAHLPKPELLPLITTCAQNLEQSDLDTCRAIGAQGASLAQGKSALRVMTHCNTGSLATAGYGTALGVIRSLYSQGLLEHVYVDETRPYLQGSRLTAFELQSEGIPYSIQTDSAAAYLMRYEKVDMVVVGADRIAANGDTANKVGTYSLAIVAQYHSVPFYVAAPRSTFDPSIPDGGAIPIELRPPQEVTEHGGHPIAPRLAQAKNPSFDVTPASLIAGIITEYGILRPPFDAGIRELFQKPLPRA